MTAHENDMTMFPRETLLIDWFNVNPAAFNSYTVCSMSESHTFTVTVNSTFSGYGEKAIYQRKMSQNISARKICYKSSNPH